MIHSLRDPFITLPAFYVALCFYRLLERKDTVGWNVRLKQPWSRYGNRISTDIFITLLVGFILSVSVIRLEWGDGIMSLVVFLAEILELRRKYAIQSTNAGLPISLVGIPFLVKIFQALAFIFSLFMLLNRMFFNSSF